jgi:hypothetical protein
MFFFFNVSPWIRDLIKGNYYQSGWNMYRSKSCQIQHT